MSVSLCISFVSAALHHTDVHTFCMFSQYLCGLFSIVHIFELREEVLIDTSIKSLINYSKLAMDGCMDGKPSQQLSPLCLNFAESIYKHTQQQMTKQQQKDNVDSKLYHLQYKAPY